MVAHLPARPTCSRASCSRIAVMPRPLQLLIAHRPGALLPGGDARDLPQGRRVAELLYVQGLLDDRLRGRSGSPWRCGRSGRSCDEAAARVRSPGGALVRARARARAQGVASDLPRLRGCARLIFVAPIIQLIVFGYAVSTDVRNTRPSSWTTTAPASLARAGRGVHRVRATSGWSGASDRARATSGDALDHGRAIVGLEIPAGFARDLASGAAPRCSSSSTAPTRTPRPSPRGYAERIVQSYAAAAAGRRRPRRRRSSCASGPGSTRTSRAANYNVPAVVGAIMLLICLLLTALAVVREREIGTLEQLMVSPLTPAS